MSDEALRIVEERFAKGEIDLAQRDLLRAKLGGAPSPKEQPSPPPSKSDEIKPASVSAEQPAKPTRKWAVIAAVLAILLVGVNAFGYAKTRATEKVFDILRNAGAPVADANCMAGKIVESVGILPILQHDDLKDAEGRVRQIAAICNVSAEAPAPVAPLQSPETSKPSDAMDAASATGPESHSDPSAEASADAAASAAADAASAASDAAEPAAPAE